MKRSAIFIAGLLFILILSNQTILAQSFEFNYQGSLRNGGTPASGNYDFEFALFDAVSVGSQVGSTITQSSVAVVGGVFSVSLNFGNQFLGASRFLEVRVRQTGGGGFTTLTPRQAVSSTPYAVKSLGATLSSDSLQLGGTPANQFVLTGDARLSDNRNPLPDSPNYIQNATAQQLTSNFNISGNGTSGGTLSGSIVNATTQYNSNSSRILIQTGSNLFAGLNSGPTISSGFENSFFGYFAGHANTTGNSNSFFGNRAGELNTVGSNNVFFGDSAGKSNVDGLLNSFFGSGAGFSNVSGARNSFFGYGAGLLNTAGNNSFFGYEAGNANTTGTNNTVIGNSADVSVGDLTFATAIGSSSVVSTSNTIQLGRNTGLDTVNISGKLNVVILGAAGMTSLCRNGSNEISTCSSSKRYKSNIDQFSPGLSLIKRLRPVSFNWLSNDQADFGLVAEEVAEVEPLLVTRNGKGEVEGVKYDRVGVVLVNAVSEQQAQIEAQSRRIDEQNETIKRQQAELDKQKNEFDLLKKLVCSNSAADGICEPKD